MNLGMTENVAVVVGASSGIGLATAREFQSEGAHVCWLDKDPNVAQQVADSDLAIPMDATRWDK